MTVHDIKDLAMIYNDADDFKVVVWDPVQQRKYDLIFTGSSKVDKVINFNISAVRETAEERERIDTLNEAIIVLRERNILDKRYKELDKKLNELNGVCEENK